jgi:hypothetical protein
MLAVVFACAVIAVGGFKDTSYEGRPAIAIANDKLEFTATTQGAWLASIVLNDDSEHLNPLWNPIRFGRELWRPPMGGGTMGGHFPCVDGFGQVSPEERVAGLVNHGEARITDMDVKFGKEGRVAWLTLSGRLLIVQEHFTRAFRLAAGESVIYVDSQLENLMGFDRPVSWGEHATIGSPFLESDATVVDISGGRSHTRNVPQMDNLQAEQIRRLAPDKDFVWPIAPGLDGKPVDMRVTPENPQFVDHTTTLLDPARKLAWATAINLNRNLLIGWLFRPEEYPGMQHWDGFPSTQKLGRAFEFATQPFDQPRRDALRDGPMFGAPTYRLLPAKSKITSRFLLFYARVPQGYSKVDDVRLENGQIVVEDRKAGRQISLTASMGL